MANTKNKEILAFSDEDLENEIVATERLYLQRSFDHAASPVRNPMELRDLRRDIARLKTEARKRELSQFSPESLANRSKIRARRRK